MAPALDFSRRHFLILGQLPARLELQVLNPRRKARDLTAPVHASITAYGSLVNGSRSKHSMGVEMDDAGTAVGRFADHVFGPAGTVTCIAVPEGNHGRVLTPVDQCVLEHPEVTPVPDRVVWLPPQPDGKLVRVAEEAGGEHFVQRVEPIDPGGAGIGHRGTDELLSRHRQVQGCRDLPIAADLVEEDVAPTGSASDPDQRLTIRLGGFDRVFDGTGNGLGASASFETGKRGVLRFGASIRWPVNRRV